MAVDVQESFRERNKIFNLFNLQGTRECILDFQRT